MSAPADKQQGMGTRTRWWCYVCRREVDKTHMVVVLSHQRKTGRCDRWRKP